MILGCIGALALLVCTATVLSAQSTDPLGVLQAAQDSLALRDNLSLSFRTQSTAYVVAPAAAKLPSQFALEGSLLLSGGRWRLEDRPINNPDLGRESLQIWNGSAMLSLSTHAASPDRDRGSVTMLPRNPHVAVPLWLLNARFGLMPPEAVSLSVFQHLLQYGQDLHAQILTELVPNPQDAPPPAQVVRVTGKVPWGDYDLWLDPARDYNFTRIVINLEGTEGDGPTKHETLAIKMTQLSDQRWCPSSYRLLVTMTLNTQQTTQLDDVTYVTDWEIDLGVAPLARAEPATSFDISWPPGVPVAQDPDPSTTG